MTAVSRSESRLHCTMHILRRMTVYRHPL